MFYAVLVHLISHDPEHTYVGTLYLLIRRLVQLVVCTLQTPRLLALWPVPRLQKVRSKIGRLVHVDLNGDQHVLLTLLESAARFCRAILTRILADHTFQTNKAFV